MPFPYVVTVILNTNRRADTCIQSLLDGDYSNHEIVLLDNASSDGSVEAIRAAFAQVQIIQLSENCGYAGNNNVGIAAALQRGADWVFVLNEDTLLASDSLSRLIATGEADARIGVVGPMVYHYDEPQVIQSAGGQLGPQWVAKHIGQNEEDGGQFAGPREVDWISGCAILVRRECVEQVGMLDERFFYYWEETEWCLRARRQGWRVVHVAEAKVWHKGVQRNYKPGPNVTYYTVRNWLLLLQKHRAPLSAWLFAAWWIAKHMTVWGVSPKWRAMREHRVAVWQATLDFVHGRWGMRPASRRAQELARGVLK